MDPVRLAVIGAGVIGRKHIETIARADSAELVAIADPDTSAESIATPYGSAYFGDYGAMLSSVKPDGVIEMTTKGVAVIAVHTELAPLGDGKTLRVRVNGKDRYVGPKKSVVEVATGG